MISDSIAIVPTITGSVSGIVLMVAGLSWDWIAACSLIVSLVTMVGVTWFIKHKRDKESVFTVNNFIIK